MYMCITIYNLYNQHVHTGRASHLGVVAAGPPSSGLGDRTTGSISFITTIITRITIVIIICMIIIIIVTYIMIIIIIYYYYY